MVTTESITIRVPVGMKQYLDDTNVETELIRNALLLYHIAWAGSRDSWNKKIRTDRYI